MIYKKIIRPILFLTDPEAIHNFVLWGLSIFNKINFLNNLLFKFGNFTSPRLRQKYWGVYFRTPIGLAGGMDKNASAPRVWSSFDFGWCQIGSITYQPQTGNKKPRLWRLPQDQGLIVHNGLANPGAQDIYKKLAKIKKSRGLWSISIAKSNQTPMDKAADDYARSVELLSPLSDIITINLSCPNVADFTGLQNKAILEPILAKITTINKHHKPLWLKIGYDLSTNQLDDIIYLTKKYHIAAIVACNLSKNRNNLKLKSKHKDKPGGVSGRPIEQKVNQIIAYLYQHSDGHYKIIGTGGIFSGQDAYEKIKAGASLLQLVTGFIYQGPMGIKQINKELDELLKQDGYSHISQAIGKTAAQYKL